MENKMSYKTKRNIIIVAAIIVLFLIASISTYLFVKGNNDTQAAQVNSTSEESDAEQQQVAETTSGETTEGTSTNASNAENSDNNQETTTTDSNNGTTVTNVATNNDNTGTTTGTTTTTATAATTTTGTQTITTIETFENSETLVGFTPAAGISSLVAGSANYTNLENELVATTPTNSGYVKPEDEILYEINIKNNGSSLTGIEVSMVIPEGVSLVEGTISNKGTEENGKITWTVDIDSNSEITVSFTAKVTAAAGEIEAIAVVDGKDTNTVIEEIDNKAPEIASLGIYNYTTNTYGEGTFAKQDEAIRLIVRFTESLETAPTVRIYSENGTVAYEHTFTTDDEQENEAGTLYSYITTLTITEAMNIAQGKIEFEVSGYADLVGNVGETVTNITNPELKEGDYPEVIYDSIAPVVTVDGYDATTGFITSGVRAVVRISDANHFTSNIAVDGTTKQTDIESDVQNDGTYADAYWPGFHGDGVYTISVKDEAGNESSITFTLDTINPKLVINGTTYDNIDEIIYVNEAATMTVEDANFAEFTSNGHVRNEDNTGWTAANDGTYKIVITDKAGNTATYTVVVDTVAPVITVDGYDEETGFVAISPEVTITDNNEFTSTIVKDDYTNADIASDKQANGTYLDKYNLSWLGDGTFTITATDVAGNTSELTFTVDTINPKLVINGTTYDNTDEIIYVNEAATMTVEDANFAEFTSNGHVRNEDNSGWTAANDGTYKIVITDKAGNTATYTVVVDKTAPVIEIDPDGKISNEDINMNVTVTEENVEKVSYIFSGYADVETLLREHPETGDEWTEVTLNANNQFSITRTTIDAYLWVKVEDKAGNVTYERSEEKFIIDKVAPTVEGVYNSSYYTQAVTPVISDDRSGVDTITLTKDGETVVEYNGGEIAEDGSYVLTVTDKAGNSTVKKFAIDTTDPELSGTGIVAGEEETLENEGVYQSASVTITDRSLTTVTVEKDGKELTDKSETYTADVTNYSTVYEEEFTENGTYTITAVDVKGHTTTITFTIDNEKPTIEIANTEYTVGNLSGSKLSNSNRYSKIGFKVTDNYGLSKLVINDVEVKDISGVTSDYYNKIEEYFGEYLKEGEVNTAYVVDLAGNVSNVVTFIYDSTAAKIAYTSYRTSDSDTAGAEMSYWSSANNILTISMASNEALSDKTTATITDSEGKTYTYSLPYDFINNVGQYIYTAKVELPEEISDGEITITISDVYDLAGNETESFNYVYYNKTIIVDKTAPTATWLYTLSNNSNDIKYIKDGEKLTVEVNVSEELNGSAYLNIGTADNYTTIELTRRLANEADNSRYVYNAYITITDEIAAYLVNDEEIPFTITGEDYVGNAMTLTTDDITVIDELGYGHVIYDNTAPKLVINGTTYENTNETIYVKEAAKMTVDDANFAEFTSNGDVRNADNSGWTAGNDGTYTIVITDKAGNSATYTVVIDKTAPVITIVEGEANKEYYNTSVAPSITDKYLDTVICTLDEEEISYEVGNTLTAEGTYVITATDESGNTTKVTFTIDTTPAERKSTDYYTNNGANNGKIYYARTGSTIVLNIRVSEELGTNPTFKLIDKKGNEVEVTDVSYYDETNQGKYYRYEISYTITDNTPLVDGDITFVVSNIVDKAGNTTADITSSTNGRTVVLDTAAPELSFDDDDNGTITASSLSIRRLDYTTPFTTQIYYSSEQGSDISKMTKISDATSKDPDNYHSYYHLDTTIHSGWLLTESGYYTVVATDAAGNSSTATIYVTLPVNSILGASGLSVGSTLTSLLSSVNSGTITSQTVGAMATSIEATYAEEEEKTTKKAEDIKKAEEVEEKSSASNETANEITNNITVEENTVSNETATNTIENNTEKQIETNTEAETTTSVENTTSE